MLYPNAIPGLVVPGDPGIPSTISPAQNHNFAPRIGLAWSPDFRAAGFTRSSATRAKQHSGQLWNFLHGISRAERGQSCMAFLRSVITI